MLKAPHLDYFELDDVSKFLTALKPLIELQNEDELWDKHSIDLAILKSSMEDIEDSIKTAIEHSNAPFTMDWILKSSNPVRHAADIWNIGYDEAYQFAEAYRQAAFKGEPFGPLTHRLPDAEFGINHSRTFIDFLDQLADVYPTVYRPKPAPEPTSKYPRWLMNAVNFASAHTNRSGLKGQP